MSIWNRIIRASFGKPPHIFARLGIFLFCVGFAAAGVLVLWSVCLKPSLEASAAAEWEPVEGKLESIGIKRDGDSEEIEASYTYTFQGEDYSGYRFQFDGNARNFATDLLESSIADYEDGQLVTVWVNPESPEQAVINRELDWTNILGLFFSIPFLTVGFCGCGWAIFNGLLHRRSMALRASAAERASSNRIASILREPHPSEDRDESIVFIDGQNRSNGAALIPLCLFWNGIVSVFIFAAVMMFASGEATGWVLAIFLIPFVLVGLLIVLGTWKAWTSQRPPDYVFVVSPIQPNTAEMDVQIQWSFVGAHNDFSEIVEFAFCLVRGAGQELVSRPRKRLRSPVDYRNFTEGDPQLRSGEMMQTLPAIDGDKLIGKYFEQNFSGSTDLLVRWRQRNQKEQELRFTLAAVSSD